MGVSYTAHCIVGCRVDPRKLYREVKVKAFDHDYREDWLVDPKTGKNLWVTDKEPVDGVEADPPFSFDESLSSGNVTVHGFEVIAPQVHDYPDRAWIAVRHLETRKECETPARMIDLYALREELRVQLPTRFWDPSTFGVHLVLECSY